MLPSFTWQEATAFNQPLSLDTSSVSNMGWMFAVRFARALPSAATVGTSLHAACTAAAPPRPPDPARMRPLLLTSPVTPQGASAFNRPLSLDTSSVTDIGGMFYVRSARALP